MTKKDEKPGLADLKREPAKFMVSSEMLPGVSRSGIGFFHPGEVFTLPDAVSIRIVEAGLIDNPSRHLIPMNASAREWLVQLYGDLAKEIPEDGEEAAVKAQTGSKLREDADAEMAAKKGKTREADK